MKPPIDPATAARIELATPFRYHLAPLPAPRESWLQRTWDAIRQFLNGIFARVHVGHSAELTIGWVVLVVFFALVAVLTLRAVSRMRLVHAGSADIEVFAEREDDDALARAAFAASERGDTIAAARLLLRAAVALLDVRGALDDDAGATIGDLRREVRAKGASAAAPFDAIASAYVTGVYAQRPIESDAWSRAALAYERLRAGAAG